MQDCAPQQQDLAKRMDTANTNNSSFPQAEDVLAKILEQTTEGIAIIREDMTVEYINDRVCEISGRARNEILNKPFLKFIHPDSSRLIMERFASRLAGENISPVYEARVLHYKGEPRDLEIHTTVLKNDENKIKILAQVRDVTKDLMIQCALSDYIVKYSTLVELMNEGFGVIDDKGALVYANTALCKMLGYIEDELLARTVGNIMHGYDLDTVFETIKKRMAGKQGRYESQLIHRSGKLIPVMVSASPLLNDEGEYKGSFAIFTDITAQKRLKKDLETARDRSLLYLDLMSHDLRNHLQEILISAELLKYKASDPSSHDFLERILHAVSKSSNIISETKTIEELAVLPLCERILDEALNETVQAAILHFDDVEFEMSIQISNACIQADAYLELLLSDLLAHACERCNKDKKKVWIRLAEMEEAYELIVSDNGLGMTTRNRSSPLDSSRPSGGLRLQLARLIVEKYSGTIEVIDRVEGDSSQGSEIRVLLPMVQITKGGIS
jgi:PAS domain S-box-containing protein